MLPVRQAEAAGIFDDDKRGSFIARAFGSYMFYQILMRSALRVVGNCKPVHCFVLDHEIAMGLMSYFETDAHIKKMITFALTCMTKSPRKKIKIAMTPAEKQKRYRERKLHLAKISARSSGVDSPDKT